MRTTVVQIYKYNTKSESVSRWTVAESWAWPEPATDQLLSSFSYQDEVYCWNIYN